MNSFRVAFVNNYERPYLGGGEVQLLLLAEELINVGIDVEVICQTGSKLAERAKAIGASVIETDLSLSSLSEARKVIAQASTDVQVLHGTGFFTNILSRIANTDRHTKVVNIHHTMADAARIAGTSSLARTLVDRATLGRVDAHVAVSNAVARSLERQGVDSEKITVIHNGVYPPPKRFVRPNQKQEVSTVGFMGRLERVKGPDTFLRAAAHLAKDYPSLRFLVAGNGSQEAALRELAHELGLEDVCTFIDYGKPLEILPLIDILMIPSRSEGFPLLAIEAQLLEVVVVATSVGGLPEIIDDGQTGILCAPEDPLELAAATKHLIDDAELRGEIAVRARIIAEHDFSPVKMADGYLALYSTLTS